MHFSRFFRNSREIPRNPNTQRACPADSRHSSILDYPFSTQSDSMAALRRQISLRSRFCIPGRIPAGRVNAVGQILRCYLPLKPNRPIGSYQFRRHSQSQPQFLKALSPLLVHLPPHPHWQQAQIRLPCTSHLHHPSQDYASGETIFPLDTKMAGSQSCQPISI